MSKMISLVPLALHPSRSLDIRDGKGTVIAVTKGVVWITQAGDKRDIFLRQGQSFTVDRNGLTLIAAFGEPASITVLPVQPQGFDVVASPPVSVDIEMGPWRHRVAQYY